MAVQIMSWQIIGLKLTRKIYPLLIHFPTMLVLTLYFKISWLRAIISIPSAYLCCQIPRWLATLAFYIFSARLAYYITYIVTIMPTLYFLLRHVSTPVNSLTQISKKSLLLFGAVPIMYYLFDYVTTIYTDLLYSGAEVAVQFTPSVVAMFYFVFVVIYNTELQKRSRARQESLMLSLQLNQAKAELESFHDSAFKASVYRHDMRHHLSLIGGFLDDGDTQKALDYIGRVQSSIVKITPNHYCQNNAANYVLAAFAAKAKGAGVTFSVQAELPAELNFPDTELCTLLSNGLENAVNAAAMVPDEAFRTVRVSLSIHKENLLILIENSFSGSVTMENGLPQSTRSGHGFGVKSISLIARSHHGYCSFIPQGEVFTLKLVLPLEK